MSFSDAMTSGRGPGLIGMAIALVVLLGFGLLFMFASDDGGTGQSLDGLVRSQTKEITGYEESIVRGNEKLAMTPSRTAAARELGGVRANVTARKEQAKALTQKVAGLRQGLEQTGKNFESYKDQYRAFVRGKAKGTEMVELRTVGGDLYKQVLIREVTPVGIQIRHAEGQKRIPFAELPEEMRDHFQYDPNQGAAALAAESAGRDQHEAEVSAAFAAMDVKLAEQREADAVAAKEKLVRDIATKEAQVQTMRGEIDGLKQDQLRAEADSAAARASGRVHVNKASTIVPRIRAKQNQLADLLAEIARMRARL